MAYLYSFFNVVFNVPYFLLFLPVNNRGGFVSIHLHISTKHKEFLHLFKDEICDLRIHFIAACHDFNPLEMPEVLRNIGNNRI